jgi:hypothetical protein
MIAYNVHHPVGNVDSWTSVVNPIENTTAITFVKKCKKPSNTAILITSMVLFPCHDIQNRTVVENLGADTT